MTAPFRLYGAELSPFSLKVRSYLRFKGLDFQWLPRTSARQEEVARYAKAPLLPLLVDAQETVLQDSTQMIAALEREYPSPSITPDDEGLAFVAALLEDYADEWLNKAMFHYRWSYPADQESAAKRMADFMFEGAPAPDGVEEAMRARMMGRLHHVGSSIETAPIIEGSFGRVVSLLDRLLGDKPYFFGGTPSLADFGLYGQLAQLASDPTPGAMIKAEAPALMSWVARMDKPRVEGAFGDLASVEAPLRDLLGVEIAGAYLPWMAANAQSVASDALGVSVEIGGAQFSQRPQRYAAKAFGELRRLYGAAHKDALVALLAETGCAAFLSAPAAKQENRDEDADEEDGGDED